MTSSIFSCSSIDDYFYNSLHDFHVVNGEINTFYRVQINFERVVAADPNGPKYDEYLQLALHQATSHVLQDYMNVHTHASVAGSMTAEIGYTLMMTAISTAISTSLIAFGSWAAKGVEGYFGAAGILASKAQLVGQIAKNVGTRVVGEMFEEVVIDGLIEGLSENLIPNQDMSFWVSSIITSIRESLSGGGGMNSQQQAQTNQEIRNWIAMRQSQEGKSGALSTELRKRLYNEFKAMQSQAAADQRATLSNFKKLLTSKAFKVLGLAVPSIFFGGFTLIGSVQIATVFGNAYNTPKAISQMYTETKNGIVERRNVQGLSSAAGISPQQLNDLWTAQMGYVSTSKFIQSEIGVKADSKVSVDALVNDKLGEFAPDTLEAMSMFGVVSKEYYKSLFSLENKKQTIEENQADLKTLEDVQESSGITFKSEDNVFLKGPNYKATPISAADPLIRFRNKITFLSVYHLDGTPMTVSKANKLFARALGMDPKQEVLSIIKGQAVVVYSTIQNENGEIMEILPTTLYTEVQEFLGYEYDSISGWTDTSQQIELLYSSELTKEQREEFNILDSNDYVPLTMMYLTPEEYEFYSETFGYYLKNNPDLLINELTVPTYRKLYNLIQDIGTSVETDIENLDTSSSTFINDIKEMMKKHWDAIFKNDIQEEFSSFTGNKKTQLILTYKYYVDKLFEDIFNDIFKAAQDNKKGEKEDFKIKFLDRLQIAIMDHILRDKLNIDAPHLTDFNKFNSELEAFLSNEEEVNNLYHFFHRTGGINKILDTLMTSFLTSPLTVQQSNKLQINRGSNTYFGFIKEQVFLIGRLRNIIIKTMKECFSTATLSQIASVRLTGERVYSSVSYHPKYEYDPDMDDYPEKPKYYNVLGLDYQGGSIFYRQKSTSRHIDGGGILDLITIAISSHLKSTNFESLIESDRETPYHLVEGLCKDGISAMIVDIIKRIVKGSDVSLERLVRLVTSFAVDDGYALNKFTSGITLGNVEHILNTFFTREVSKMGNKLASHEVFLVQLVKLINTQLYADVKHSGQMHTEQDLKDAILIILLDNKEDVIEIAHSSNLKHFANNVLDTDTDNGFLELSNFLTETNFNKLVIREKGQYKLSLIFEYNPLFKTNEPLSVSDFPNGMLFTLRLNYADNIRPLTTDQDLQSIIGRSESHGLVVCHHSNHPGSIILVPSDRLKELSGTRIKIGYKQGGIVYQNIFACDNSGDKLISKLEFSASGVSIRRGVRWIIDSYQTNLAFEGDDIIGFQSNFYAAYTFTVGSNPTVILQDTTVILEHMEPYKDPLHQLISDLTKKNRKRSPNYIIPNLKTISQLDLDTKNELVEILSAVNQFLTITEKRVSYKYDSISDLIVSQDFFDGDFNKIITFFNELNPTMDQLSDLSYSRQKLFYHTFNEMFKVYSGTSKLINDYKKLFNSLTFGESSPKTAGLHSYKYTQEEFKAIVSLESILLQLLGARFFAMLKLGAILFYMESNTIRFQPISFNRWLVQENLNAKRIKVISAFDMNPYKRDNIAAHTDNYLSCYFVFGHKTAFDVIGKDTQIIKSYGSQSFISDLIRGEYHKPSNPNTISKDFGTLNNIFLETYGELILPDLAGKRNLQGKNAIMNGFGKMYLDHFTPLKIKSVGISQGMKVFGDNPYSISANSFNYALQKTFEYLINPKRDTDPTGAFSRVFKGTAQSTSFTIESNAGWRTLWERSLGTIILDFTTIGLYFGKDLSLIQPALFYTERNLQPGQSLRGKQPLSVLELMTPQFDEKITHLYDNLYKILSTSYHDGDQLTVTFHRDSSHGIHEKSLLGLVDHIRNKFPNLIKEQENSLSIIIQKQSDKIVNNEEFNTFIASIVFYMIMFNAKALLQENDGSYGLIASQRELLDADYIFQLGVTKLSETGKQILATYQSSWNLNVERRIVWNYGDCWPIYLFSDAKELIVWFKTHFFNGGGTVSRLKR